jgi:hypothetical protein
MDKKEQAKLFKKYGITARKYGGDDCYSWAVFLWGKPVYTGMGRSEVDYYKRQVLESEIKRGFDNPSN